MIINSVEIVKYCLQVKSRLNCLRQGQLSVQSQIAVLIFQEEETNKAQINIFFRIYTTLYSRKRAHTFLWMKQQLADSNTINKRRPVSQIVVILIQLKQIVNIIRHHRWGDLLLLLDCVRNIQGQYTVNPTRYFDVMGGRKGLNELMNILFRQIQVLVLVQIKEKLVLQICVLDKYILWNLKIFY